MELAGYMVFTFDGRNVFEELEKDSRYARMVLLSENEDVIFQSAKQENWKGILENDRYMVLKEAVNHYNVCMFLDKQKAAQLSWSTFLTIIGVGLLAILLGISCIQYYVRRLTRRVNSILGAMNQVTTGDLQVRLAIENNSDELDMIASKFNDMCEKLELYIQKSYLAEIERKNAQMQALQSQINPHFLYNTLEAIRMKAICNGDREVGKMLYSMVALFRSQIKEADIITLGQELDYCKQYLELFEYRYNGSFQSEVDCRPDLLSTPVIKFILQPIVENYFIHGIDRNRTDNKVCIRAEQNGEKLCLYVQDNGVGMSADEIRQKNEELKANLSDEEGKKSIGIVNVNRRIKAVYGEEYGIFIQAVQPRGLLVIVTIKAKERKEHEKGHVGRG